MSKPNLLWVGDACVPSGFANCTHRTLDVMRHNFNVTVLGLNYRGDPYNYPYPVYAAMAGGDAFGINRLIWMCDLVKPDVIVIQNDPWNIPSYTHQLKTKTRNYDGDYADVPVVAAIAVDGKNCLGRGLNDLSLGVFWTQFGFDEARAGGFARPGCVIPLGVDLGTYKPMHKTEALTYLNLPPELNDKFIVGNVNRNQPRKRLDLTIKYFAEWVKTHNVKDAMLFLHVAPTGDTGIDVLKLAQYYGVHEQLMLAEPEMFVGKTEAELRATYCVFDTLVSTTQGEGWGLTAMEAMACGVPCILPDWSAFGEWAKGAARLVPCSSTAIGPPYVNVIGGVVDETQFIGALDNMYRFPDARKAYADMGRARVQEDRFDWTVIGQQFNDAVQLVLKK